MLIPSGKLMAMYGQTSFGVMGPTSCCWLEEQHWPFEGEQLPAVFVVVMFLTPSGCSFGGDHWSVLERAIFMVGRPGSHVHCRAKGYNSLLVDLLVPILSLVMVRVSGGEDDHCGDHSGV